MNTILDDGSYMSTQVRDKFIINTYFLDGFFVDMVFDADLGEVLEITLDEAFCLNAAYVAALNGFSLNLN